MTIGTEVAYKTRGKRKRVGKIDKTANGPDGKRLYRVDDHWFHADRLVKVN